MIDIKSALKALAIAFDNYCKANNINAELYAVGGVVRNELLNLSHTDIDICSKLTPNEIIEFCKSMGYKYVPKGIAFGMVEIHFTYESETLCLEHTTFRSINTPMTAATALKALHSQILWSKTLSEGISQSTPCSKTY